MRVQPGTLPGLRLWPEREEVLEYSLVHDNAADDANKEGEAGQPHQNEPHRVRFTRQDIQCIVKVDEEAPADRTCRNRSPGPVRHKRLPGKFAVLLKPVHHQNGIAVIGRWQCDSPEPGIRRRLLQVGFAEFHQIGGIRHAYAVHFRASPDTDLEPEYADGARDKNGHQQPAENEAGPGVQPRHFLGKALFFHSQSPAHVDSSVSGLISQPRSVTAKHSALNTSKPVHAFLPVTENTQITMPK